MFPYPYAIVNFFYFPCIPQHHVFDSTRMLPTFTAALCRSILTNQIRKFSSETGVVSYFNKTKGYGFINRDAPGDGPLSAFIHFNDINSTGFKTLYQSQRVSFDIRSTTHGVQAVNITALPGKTKAMKTAEALVEVDLIAALEKEAV